MHSFQPTVTIKKIKDTLHLDAKRKRRKEQNCKTDWRIERCRTGAFCAQIDSLVFAIAFSVCSSVVCRILSLLRPSGGCIPTSIPVMMGGTGYRSISILCRSLAPRCVQPWCAFPGRAARRCFSSETDCVSDTKVGTFIRGTRVPFSSPEAVLGREFGNNSCETEGDRFLVPPWAIGVDRLNEVVSLKQFPGASLDLDVGLFNEMEVFDGCTFRMSTTKRLPTHSIPKDLFFKTTRAGSPSSKLPSGSEPESPLSKVEHESLPAVADPDGPLLGTPPSVGLRHPVSVLGVVNSKSSFMRLAVLRNRGRKTLRDLFSPILQYNSSPHGYTYLVRPHPSVLITPWFDIYLEIVEALRSQNLFIEGGGDESTGESAKGRSIYSTFYRHHNPLPPFRRFDLPNLVEMKAHFPPTSETARWALALYAAGVHRDSLPAVCVIYIYIVFLFVVCFIWSTGNSLPLLSLFVCLPPPQSHPLFLHGHSTDSSGL